MKKVIIIPARFHSERFPGKVLAPIAGKPMIQWVYEHCLASSAQEVFIATDHKKVVETCSTFCDQVVLTDTAHRSGTSRCIELAKKLAGAYYIMNVQADEPMLPPDLIDALFDFIDANSADIATLVNPVFLDEDLKDPNVVKCVLTHDQRALYFSRSLIPFPRDQKISGRSYYKHIGVYVFRRKSLLDIEKMPSSVLEDIEKLEQLRWLQAGKDIYCKMTDYLSRGVDTPEDLKEVESLIQSGK